MHNSLSFTTKHPDHPGTSSPMCVPMDSGSEDDGLVQDSDSNLSLNSSSLDKRIVTDCCFPLKNPNNYSKQFIPQ